MEKQNPTFKSNHSPNKNFRCHLNVTRPRKFICFSAFYLKFHTTYSWNREIRHRPKHQVPVDSAVIRNSDTTLILYIELLKLKRTLALILYCYHLITLFWPQWACLDVPPWCRRGWILWALAPSSWTSRLSPRGSSNSVRRRRPTRATACPARRPSPRPSPSGPTSTASSSSCESHGHFFISLSLCGNVLCFNRQGHFKPPVKIVASRQSTALKAKSIQNFS